MKDCGPVVSIKRVFQTALSQFIREESDHIRTGVSERNLCARLAPVLECVAIDHGLVGYFADAEYNRKQNGLIKTIIDENMEEVKVQCDLILHSRGKYVERDNLIAIEMKKSNRPGKEWKSDRTRLRALTKSSYDGIWSNDGETHPEHVCGYELGALVVLYEKKQEFQVEYFVDGDFTGPIETMCLSD